MINFSKQKQIDQFNNKKYDAIVCMGDKRFIDEIKVTRYTPHLVTIEETSGTLYGLSSIVYDPVNQCLIKNNKFIPEIAYDNYRRKLKMSVDTYVHLFANLSIAISTYLLNHMNIKVSHVTISKWIKKFDKYFKSISDELTKNLYLGDSDEWHADETVVKINAQKYYLWICIDSETRFITSWNLNKSREAECAFSLFKQAKRFGKPNSIVTDGLPSYREPVKNTFEKSTHIVVKDFDDDISNNLIESFNKTFKSWYKKTKGFKSFESANSLISNFIFYYNFIKSHSSLSGLTPAQVCGINYTHQEKVNWFIKY